MSERRRKHWGWGWEDQQPSLDAVRAGAEELARRLGLPACEPQVPVALEQAQLPAVRVVPPASLQALCVSDDHARASHALGKSYGDIVEGFRGRFVHAPDAVARPRDEREVEAVLEWCSAERVAVIPYGGGTSVVGGVTPSVGEGYNGVVSLDTSRLARVLEVDPVSRSARIEAGADGPSLERQLAEHGLTLRFFPQSFEYATLGGWVATRAAGHFATRWTHIEDLVEAVRAITPVGQWESRRLPGSGAGVSPDRMLAGSEGILGVITSAWVRVQPRPERRASAGIAFESFSRGADCVREISQSGLAPSNCRLLDTGEAALTMAGDGSHALLVLGFEATGSPVDEAMSRALAICSAHGGRPVSGGADSAAQQSEGDAVGAWRSAFLGAPYLRDTLVALGYIAETFETAVTWERFGALHERVTRAGERAIAEVCGGEGRVHCRFTHVYPDGPAPYFTVLARGRPGEEIEQWAAIKAAVSDALIEGGATITHHHAVGRDHRPWYDRQRPDVFAQALGAAKQALDPAGVLNPGVLIGGSR